MCLNGILHLAGIKTLLTVCFCRQRHAGENPAVAGYETYLVLRPQKPLATTIKGQRDGLVCQGNPRSCVFVEGNLLAKILCVHRDLYFKDHYTRPGLGELFSLYVTFKSLITTIFEPIP